MAAAAKNKKIDWNEEDEDDRGKKLIKSVEVKKIVETPVQDGNKQAIQKDIYVIRKTLVPVRRAVKDRKNWAKFGEVEGYKRGEHKLGDYAKENEVNIQTSAEEQGGEFGIVAQLEGITTQGMREKQLERKKKDLETGGQAANATSTSDSKKKGGLSKLEEVFSKVSGSSGEVSLRINDIYPTDQSRKILLPLFMINLLLIF